MNHKQADQVRQNVRKSYSEVAEANNNGDCCGEQASCCGVSSDASINTLVSTRLGYSTTDLDSVPDGADMGLGCGNLYQRHRLIRLILVLSPASNPARQCWI